jgi:CheY-like chemotaxis protein/HPt (histidine-containing phosphotransfer) domain-containing protein
VSEAHDGAQGVARAAAEKFDLILMDISMPVMDGRQATQAIRSGNGASANAPIIAFTANVMPDEMALFTAGGMDDTLSKPIDVDALRQIIEKYAMGRTTHEANVEAPMEESNLLDLHRINETRELIGQQNFDKLFGRFEAEMDVLTEWLAHPENAPMPEIEVRCHKIASSAGTFGAVELRLALMAAETTARSRKQLDLSLACEKIIALWKDTRRAFRALEES